MSHSHIIIIIDIIDMNSTIISIIIIIIILSIINTIVISRPRATPRASGLRAPRAATGQSPPQAGKRSMGIDMDIDMDHMDMDMDMDIDMDRYVGRGI